MHYRSQCCDHEHKPVALDFKDFNLSRLVQNYIDDVFRKNLSDERRLQLINQYAAVLSDALNVNFSAGAEFYDEDLAKKLQSNIRRFSAFKETSFKEQLEKLITQSGKVLPRNEFLKQAKELSDNYNANWLRTEYDQTVSSGRMAQKWKRFEANADIYPNLRYETVGDDRVRQQHRQWDGLVLPMNHSFWNNHTPPNDWGCRCDLVQTDAAPNRQIADGSVKDEFQNNAGKTGKVFNGSAYEKTVSDTGKKQAERLSGQE